MLEAWRSMDLRQSVMQESHDWSFMRLKARLVNRKGLPGSFWMLRGPAWLVLVEGASLWRRRVIRLGVENLGFFIVAGLKASVAWLELGFNASLAPRALTYYLPP